MILAVSSFLEFCYLVRRSVVTENDLANIRTALADFHLARKIFIETGIRSDFNLPRQHAMVHYPVLITEFGAPNGLCSSITESLHIKAVKEPYRRSNRFNALGQMLLTNQRLDKLAAARVDFTARGMLIDNQFADILPPANAANNDAVQSHHPPPPVEDEESGAIDKATYEGEVILAKTRGEILF